MIIETAVARSLGFGPGPALALGAVASAGTYVAWKRYKKWRTTRANAQWSAQTLSGQYTRSGFHIPPGA